MKGFSVALTVAVAILPFATFAAPTDQPAGFAPTSIFASKTRIIAGDTISLFTVLYNSSDAKLAGDAVFTIDGHSVGTKHVELGAGDTQTVSTSWTAVEGSHTASAHMENVAGASGEKMTLLNGNADTITLSVAKALPPSPTVQALTSAASAIETGAYASAPAFEQAARKAFNSLEYLRQNAVHTLENQLAPYNSRVEPSDAKKVLGVSTHSTSSPGARETSSILGTVWHSLLLALLFVCQTRTLFYLLLAFVAFMLFRLLMTFVRERRANHRQ